MLVDIFDCYNRPMPNGKEFVLYAAVICYSASLFLVGITYRVAWEPDDYRHPGLIILCPQSQITQGGDLEYVIEGVVYRHQFISSVSVSTLNEDTQKFVAGLTVADPSTPHSNIREICLGQIASVENTQVYGWSILMFGWNVFGTGLVFAWYANVLFFLAILFAKVLRKYEISQILSWAAFLLGMTSFFFHGNTDEVASYVYYVDHLAIGFYVWETSFILLAIYSFIHFPSRDK